MIDPSVPADVVTLADERAAARARHDYGTADELKARIEVLGWRVVDFGVAYELSPALPPDISEGEQTYYGAVGSVPSLLESPATTAASVVVVLGPGASADPTLDALSEHAPAGTQVLVVTNYATSVEGPAGEVIRGVTAFTAGDAIQAGLRRITGSVVVVLEPEQVPAADIVGPIIRALDDPTVAIVTAWGLQSTDLHRYQAAERGDATTVASGCYGFRREDAITRGPVDGRLQLRGSVAAWLGLVLRDEGPERTPRRALIVDLPLDTAEGTEALPNEHVRLARRDGYRIADRFRDHDWLARENPPQRRVVGDRPNGREHDDDTDEAGHTHEA